MSRDWGFVTVAFGDSRDLIAEQAARRFSNGGYGEVNYRSVGDSVRAVVRGRADHALVSVEDSMGTSGAGLLPIVRDNDGVRIVGEVVTDLRASLMTLPGVDLGKVRTVVGRHEVIEAVADTLAGLSVELRTTRDVTLEAKLIFERDDRLTALLAPAEFAPRLGLVVARENVAQRQRHWVRHWVFGTGETTVPGTRSCLLLGPVHGPRTLKTFKSELQSRGASRVRIADRRGSEGEEFLVEFDHPPGVGEAILKASVRFCRYRFLGTWNTDQDVAQVA